MSDRESVPEPGPKASPDLDGIARSFVDARLRGAALKRFPGAIPADLVTAYQVQDLAIGRWPDRVVGWKVGFIGPDRRETCGDERLLGPIFANALQVVDGQGEVDFEIFEGGFGAVEAEYVLRLEDDLPAETVSWTAARANDVPATLHIGVEVASSPLSTINQLGPRVVVSDFGNNNGLILGPEIQGWREMAESDLTCHTTIEGQLVGSGGATTLPGGLRAALAFALTRSAQRGRRMQAGDLIATGNATGIHDIRVGQRACVSFDGYGDILCRARAVRIRDHDA